jgi:hypothetical protein
MYEYEEVDRRLGSNIPDVNEQVGGQSNARLLPAVHHSLSAFHQRFSKV